MATSRRDPLRNIAMVNYSSRPSGIPNVWMPPTPVMSPDEQVIQQRSKRRMSTRNSPAPKVQSKLNKTDITDLLDTSFDGSDLSFVDSNTPLRSDSTVFRGIRKRLLLSPSEDFDHELSFPKGLSPPNKKRKAGAKKGPSSDNLEQRLHALSNEQLIEVITSLTGNHPELQQEIEELVPAPDIAPLIDNLEFFKKNIFKSLPRSSFGSLRDASCYRRVKTHVMSFKDACISQGKQLQETQSWPALSDYIQKAWGAVEGLPDWDNDSHNKTKQMCYKSLAALFKQCIKSNSLKKEELQVLKNWVDDTSCTHSELKPSIQLVEKKIRQISK